MSVTVTSQAELDQALIGKAEIIYIKSEPGVWLQLNNTGSSRVVARGSSSVEARDSSRVEAWGSSSVVARDSSSVVARDSSSVVARDSSRVEAWGSSSVVAWDSSRVAAWDSSSVVARDSSSVEARGSSSVEARDSSSVAAWGSSRVEAWDSSSVEAWGSSSVEAWDSSSVAASKYVAVHLRSTRVALTGDGHLIDLTLIDFDDPLTWCEYHGVTVEDGIAYLYKAVNGSWTTERGTDYSPGSLPEAADWDPAWRECGRGLHFCDHPLRSLDFIGTVDGPRFVKCGVRLDEVVCLGDKVKARRVVVACVEVDRHGDPVAAQAVTA